MTAKNKSEIGSETDTSAPLLLWGAPQLAGLLGVTPRTLQNMAERGLAVRAARGKYDVLATVRLVLDDLRAGTTEEGLDAKARWEEERARLTKARADKAELELAILRGDAVLMPDVETLITEEYGSLRLGLSQLSGSVARKLAEEDKPAVCQDIVARAIEGALKNLTADRPGGKRPRTRHLPGADGLADDEEIINAVD
ncbi:hypothetical protein [Paracoccus sp. SSK6]|uniref:hypothetical protein n=1 Tax=Paracoccus sp. SSK6 TaxID=3143131 RepID=UPI00321A28CD